MSAGQLNFLAILGVLGVGAVMVVFVGLLSSRALRDEGFRSVVKRWLGH